MSVHAYTGASPYCQRTSFPLRLTSLWQLMGSATSSHTADQADIRNRCEGSVQESTGANRWSCST